MKVNLAEDVFCNSHWLVVGSAFTHSHWSIVGSAFDYTHWSLVGLSSITIGQCLGLSSVLIGQCLGLFSVLIDQWLVSAGTRVEGEANHQPGLSSAFPSSTGPLWLPLSLWLVTHRPPSMLPCLCRKPPTHQPQLNTLNHPISDRICIVLRLRLLCGHDSPEYLFLRIYFKIFLREVTGSAGMLQTGVAFPHWGVAHSGAHGCQSQTVHPPYI